MTAATEQMIIHELHENWVWSAGWIDSSASNTAGRIVRFRRHVCLPHKPLRALLHFSADTRYKLYVNGKRVAVGPARGSHWLWYYDTLDVASFLHAGDNELLFLVLRYFPAIRAAIPFARTALPGLTVIGSIECDSVASQGLTGKVENALAVNVRSAGGDWTVQVDDSVQFPMGLPDDMFLHINERILPSIPTSEDVPIAYGIRTANGELAPWRLRPRGFPMPEESPLAVDIVRKCRSTINATLWTAYLSGKDSLLLDASSSHSLEVQAAVHSTAFLRWVFRVKPSLSQVSSPSTITLKVTYSEGYEHEPRDYPFFRSKSNRLDAEHGYLIGPFDEVTFALPSDGQAVDYEPFWLRTFRIMRLDISVVGELPVELVSFAASQANYPMTNVRASWDAGDQDSASMWEVSVRTLRNCMFDAYVDCPFYEQLQYAGDTRSVGLFHYLLSGDDRLMRQAITNFAMSVQIEGLTQSRFPSHVTQVIAGFGLFWVLQVCDHHLFFGDRTFARGMLPRIDGVLDFFDRHIASDTGLVAALPTDVWQYVDWVTSWGATADHPDKGVPTAGRAANCHTFFSLLYAFVLRHASYLCRDVGRPGHADEYLDRAGALILAVREYCFDGQFFTDTAIRYLSDSGHKNSSHDSSKYPYSQHCQVFAVLAGAALPQDRVRLLTDSLADPRFAPCSYVMKFYTLRAFSLASDDAYECVLWPSVWDPWRRMLANNLSTWEEDDVRQRSDCHAWGSIPIFEYCTEVAGIHPVAPGAMKLLFKPRLRLTHQLHAKVCLGRDNLATVKWSTDSNGYRSVHLTLNAPLDVISVLPGCQETAHGVVDAVSLTWKS